MKIIKKLMLLALMLSPLTVSQQTHAMDNMGNLIIKCMLLPLPAPKQVLSESTIKKIHDLSFIVGFGCWGSAVIPICLGVSLDLIEPIRSVYPELPKCLTYASLGCFGMGFSAMLAGGYFAIHFQEELIIQRFIDRCKNNNPAYFPPMISNGLSFSSFDITTHRTILQCIEYRDFFAFKQVIKNNSSQEVIQVLLENGACNLTCLKIALTMNHAKTIRTFLLHLHNRNLLDDMEKGLMENASLHRLFKMYRTLCIEPTINPVHDLQYGCLFNDINMVNEAISILKEKLSSSFNINVFGLEKTSLLHLAASQNNVYIIKLLLKIGHNPNTKNSRGFTALDSAQQHGHKKSVDVLLTNEAINFDNNPAFRNRSRTKTLLTKIPVPISTSTQADLTKKIDTITYLCTLLQHKHDTQPLVEKLASIKPQKIKSAQTLEGLPVNTIMSFLDNNDVPRNKTLLYKIMNK